MGGELDGVRITGVNQPVSLMAPPIQHTIELWLDYDIKKHARGVHLSRLTSIGMRIPTSDFADASKL
ncbi:MAG TPA: hypothetical protein ACHBX2_08370 [Arsenophonus nasoniae]